VNPSTIGCLRVAIAAGEREGNPAMHRFRSPTISLALSVILTLLSAAVALAEGQPPNPR
jgi:heme/copper-type cytochrome/quinol oxidase subunit 4